MRNVCTRSATLDLTAPVAASRRLDVALTDKGRGRVLRAGACSHC